MAYLRSVFSKASTGGGLAVLGTGTAAGGWWMSSSLSEATAHADRVLVEVERWGGRIHRLTANERLDAFSTTARKAVVAADHVAGEVRRQSELWREEATRLQAATEHVVAHSELLAKLEQRGDDPAEVTVGAAVHPKLVSQLSLVAAGIENPDSLRQLTALARTLSARDR